MPKRSIDGKSSTINCNNGKVYSLDANDLYAYSDELSHTTDKDARILCKYNTQEYYDNNYPREEIEKNYKFIPAYKYPEFYKYIDWFIYSVFSFALTVLSLKLIRIGFVYVVTGEKPYWIKEIFNRWY